MSYSGGPKLTVDRLHKFSEDNDGGWTDYSYEDKGIGKKYHKYKRYPDSYDEDGNYHYGGEDHTHVYDSNYGEEDSCTNIPKHQEDYFRQNDKHYNRMKDDFNTIQRKMNRYRK